MSQKNSEYEELLQQHRKQQEEMTQIKNNKEEEITKLKERLKNEMLLKQVAVNKLAEVMNRRDTDLQSKWFNIILKKIILFGALLLEF